MLVVGNALREHLGVHRVEGVLVLPHRFTLADSGVATHVGNILGMHLIDQELALTVAVVRWRSDAEVPTHAGFRIVVVAARSDDRIRRPLINVGLQRLRTLARGGIFPSIHFFLKYDLS